MASECEAFIGKESSEDTASQLGPHRRELVLCTDTRSCDGSARRFIVGFGAADVRKWFMRGNRWCWSYDMSHILFDLGFREA